MNNWLLKNTAVTHLLFWLLVATSSCGVKDNDQSNGGGNPNLNLSPFEQLVGDWSGIYRALENNKPFGDASDAKFQLNNNATFSLTLNADGSARAEGEWSEFQGRSMILKITGSSIPRIGAAGKIVEPAYELQGTSLRISSDLFELKFTRKTDEPGGSPGQSAPKEIFGAWSCQDSQGRQSSLGLSSDGTFSLSSVKPGQRLFIAKGPFTSDQSNVFRLTPTSVSDPLPPGSYLEFRTSSSAAELSITSPSPQRTTSLGTCHH